MPGYCLKETHDTLNNPSVHNLTKDILRAANHKDIIDRYYDVKMAADILKAEMDNALESTSPSDHTYPEEERFRTMERTLSANKGE